MQFSKRHILPALGVVAIATVALAGCSSSGGSSSSPASTANAKGGIPATTITVMAPDYGNGPTSANYTGKWWDAMVKEFNKQYPQITVNVTVLPWSGASAIDSKIQAAVQAGNPPDIAQGSADWVGFPDQVYDAKDVLTPAVLNDLTPIFAKQGDVNGVAKGIPWVASSRALVYNKAMFQKAGISAPPTSWAEYKTDAQKLKAAGVQTPACVPFGSEEAQAEFFIWTLGNGGGYVNSSGKWDIDSAQNVETFKFLSSLESAGLIQSSPGTTNRTAGSNSCWAQFEAGHVGMTNSQNAEYPRLQASAVKSDYAFAPVVGKDGVAKTTVGVNDWIWAFKTKDNHQAADKAFLSFALNKENQLSLFKEYAMLPVIQSAANEVSSSTPVLKPFIDALPTATFYPVDQKTWPLVSKAVQQGGAAAISSNPSTTLKQIQQTALGSN